jgi:AcrR family transcriptional regulator
VPQVLKEEVRQRILGAALEELAAHGYEGASMARIAERAGLGTATSYRYFAGKAELFDAVITPELARRFETLLERRVKALSRNVLGPSREGRTGREGREGREGGGVLGGDPRDDDAGEEMLRFWIDHRLAVVVLLDRAQGTAYAHFGERFVEHLVTGTLAQIRAARPGVRVSAPARFVLTRIFENTRRLLASVLAEHEREAALREAIEAFWTYQIAGLKGFTAWVAAANG